MTTNSTGPDEGRKGPKSGRLRDCLNRRKIDAAIRRRGARTIKVPDGNGLFLVIAPLPSNAASWVHRIRVGGGKRPDVGLGPYPLVSLAEARKRRDANLLRRQDGLAIMTARKAAAANRMTLKLACEKAIAATIEGAKAANTVAQWKSQLLGGASLFKSIWDRPIGLVTREEILDCLREAWRTKTPTAALARARLEAVMDWAVHNGHRARGENPAAWATLKHDLPKVEDVHKTEGRRAMPYDDLPAFVRALRQRRGGAAKALELVILTGGRSEEILDARVSEFDLEERLWVIPAERMKNRAEHVIPLTDRAAAIVAEAIEGKSPDAHVFTNPRGGRFEGSVLRALMERMDSPFHVHGFRSSFSSWRGARTPFAEEVGEAALSHKPQGVKGRYMRDPLLEKRRALMAMWEDHIEARAGGDNVVPITVRSA
jgi:integrase